jgi:CxxC-x17-CxxC domain-containing protein
MAEFKTIRRNGGRGRSSDRTFNRSSSRSSNKDTSRFSSRGRSNNKRDLPPCDAVCATCGKDCKVPFKPTANKPVYCSNCFENVEKTNSRENYGSSNNNLDQINEKLDKILSLLEQNKRR